MTWGRGARRSRRAGAVILVAAVFAGCDLGAEPVRLDAYPGRGVFDVLGVDIDGDADTDLVAKVDYGLAVLRNDGSGAFTATTSDTNVRYYVEFLAGDVTGDGHPDLLGLLYGGVLEYRAGNGAGGFASTRRPLPTPTPVTGGPALGDIDGDGDLDVLAATGLGTAVWTNDGAGRFPNPDLLDTGSTDDVALGDLDGDDDLDVVAGSAIDTVLRVALGDGTGDFAAPVGHEVLALAPSAMTLADVDGDDDLDVVAGSGSDADIQVAPGDGAGGLGPALVTERQLGEPQGTTELATADIDGDGVLDVVTAGRPSSVLFGDGTGRFVEPHDVVGGDELVVSDLDGDGRPDAVYTTPGSEQLRYLRNALQGRTHD